MKVFSDNLVKKYSNTVGIRNRVDTTLALPLFVQTLLGQQILDPKWRCKSNIVKHLCLLMLHTYAIIGTIVFIRDVNDTTLKAEAYFTVVITAMLFIKYLLYLYKRVTFQKAYLMAKTDLYNIIKECSREKADGVLEKIKMFIRILFFTVFFPVKAYMLAACWNCLQGTKTTLSKTTSILMPMTTPYYEIGLSLHTIFMFGISYTVLVIDMWFVILTFFFCEASDALEKFLKVEPRSRNEGEGEYAIRLNGKLRYFYTRHVALMKYLNIISSMYKWPTLIPLLNVLLIFCLILFMMSEEMKLTFLSNLLPCIVECFAYNWFGEQLKIKTKTLKLALLEFDWTGMSVKDRRKYLFIVSYMTKEFSLKTAAGSDLSMATMTVVLKASYQAFAVLKSTGN